MKFFRQNRQPFWIHGTIMDTNIQVLYEITPTKMGWRQRSQTPGFDRDYISHETKNALLDWVNCDLDAYAILNAAPAY
mgnify:CR=1 FL=1